MDCKNSVWAIGLKSARTRDLRDGDADAPEMLAADGEGFLVVLYLGEDLVSQDLGQHELTVAEELEYQLHQHLQDVVLCLATVNQDEGNDDDDGDNDNT